MEVPNVTVYNGAPYSFSDGTKKSLKTAGDQSENAGGDFLLIEDLLDFSNEEIGGAIEPENCTGDFPSHVPQIADSSTVTAETTTSTDRTLLSSSDSANKGSHIPNEHHSQYNFCNPGADLCVPCDDLAELEWLSNFVEDSFSTGGVHREVTVLEANSSSDKAMYASDTLPVPVRARSKRSRAPVCNWVSRIVHSPSVKPSAKTLEHASTAVAAASSTDSGDALLQGGAAESLLLNKVSKRKKSAEKVLDDRHMNATRKCSHCATQKTPQWRAGPMGPKTLCNACGVRFKSGRLLPEYRPAASPTFVVSKHSNSHKKVLDMRRQKFNYVKYDDDNDDDDEEEQATEGLQDYMCSEDQSYFSHSADGCLFHNTRQDFI